MANLYNLKKINSSKHKDIAKLMKLYSCNIAPSARTDTREILYWLDNSTDDYFQIFAFYLNELLIGYCQVAYFPVNKLLFIDYIVIDEHYRGRAYFEFVYSIKDYFEEKNIEINYYLAEVPHYSTDETPSHNSITMIRLLKQSGFKVVKAGYFQPELGKNKESCMKTTLLIYSQDQSFSRIKKETFEDIVKTIYYDHYFKWYNMFLQGEDLQNYRKQLDHLYSDVIKKVVKKKHIELNGYNHLIEGKTTPPEVIKEATIVNIATFFIAVISITAILMLIASGVCSYFSINKDHLYYALTIVVPLSIPLAKFCTSKMKKFYTLKKS